ncbi:isoamylase early set domain-containing protein [Allostreptomyces psammosilenae]|uniref:1,4-alpha-glucan branching enzyme n=1 Tax=Allostreptomyces psammosilenae TaxID=1892865 RepID=A0A853A012_9ACTN|nr:isoamylase early set domain-containing protein [Allostreptomyces psammosilenae]NYI04161.1 1,4-alpha-glucan branching enzyme [Allostreptomyces psammosilenae]
MLTRTYMTGGKARVTFRLPAGTPFEAVSVVGEFNAWQPGRHELVQRRDGTRSCTVTLSPGAHRFRYLATGGVWFDEEQADLIDAQGSVIKL